MAPEQLRFFCKYITVVLRFGTSILFERIEAFIHRFTYKNLPSSQNVVVIGGSFAGAMLARRLAESLPSGYRVILIEKNSHFNYVFNFPRYSVVPEREHRAFIPYTGLMEKVPEGIFEQIQDAAIEIRAGEVELASGRCIPFAYLAIATGVSQNPPAKATASKKRDACNELRALQTRIQEAKRIALIGAGPVGVQTATDIKTFYPEKEVTLVHSRQQLLSNFGKGLHEYVMPKLHSMGIEVKLGERLVLPSTVDGDVTELSFQDGTKEDFDLIIPCTGQIPNSSIIEQYCPSAVSSTSHRILVRPTLQLEAGTKQINDFDNIFALGDVAESGGPKMGRAGFVQAGIVQKNILALIKGKTLTDYKPMSVEGILELKLGKDESVLYAQHEDGDEFIIPAKSKKVDLDVEKAWKLLGGDIKTAHV